MVLVLLYRCETWKMNKGDNKALYMFLYKCLRRILNIQWQDHISTEELLRRTNMNPLRRKKKKRKTKDYLETYSGEKKRRGGVEIMGGSNNGC